MTVEYLRRLCQGDEFARGTYDIDGEVLSLKGVKVPLCAIACETDHIAAWRSSFRGVAGMGSKDKTFILAESGHIAGIVNPPARRKYGHYISDATLEEPDSWRAGASRQEGSWWPRWEEWLRRRSGKLVPARAPGSEAYPPLCPAPGTYVVQDPNH
jgi:polyhydroxyalkanoate synthase